jgi:hypothetical protein
LSLKSPFWLRIDEDGLRKLDLEHLAAIARAYGSAKINNLIRFLTRVKGTAHA